jgi:hypothetical protein
LQLSSSRIYKRVSASPTFSSQLIANMPGFEFTKAVETAAPSVVADAPAGPTHGPFPEVPEPYVNARLSPKNFLGGRFPPASVV